MFPSATVRPLFDNVIPVELYTDNGTEENNNNAKLREELTKTAANPVYVMLNSAGEVVDIHVGSTPGPDPFKAWFESAYKKAGGQ